MNSRSRLLMIMYGKGVGGAEFQFIELANFLATTYQVRLVSLGGDGALMSAQVDPQIETRVYHYSGYFNTALVLLKAFFDNLLYPSKSVVTTSFIGNTLGWAINVFRKRRLISLQTVSKCMHHPFVDRFVLRGFDVLIAGAADIKEYLIASGQDANRIHVVHNWVDFSKRKPSESVQETRIKLEISSQIIIGCVGRLHPQKGQIFLIRAFERILEKFPDTTLLLMGDGETRDSLEEEVARLGLAGKVIFTGTVTGDEYNNYLTAVDIYVQPSLFEGLPRTLLDAMYVGKAVIATAVNGNLDVIQDRVNGLVIPSEDEQAIAVAVLTLLENPQLAAVIAKQAHRDVIKSFDLSKQLPRIEQLLSWV